MVVPSWPPAYRGVVTRLRAQILRGRLRPATRLAAERQLCARFRVSRITIRHALRLLQEEGLIHRRHGSGTYIRPNPTPRIPLMIDYTGSMRDHAPRLRRRLLRQRWEAAGDDVAERLEIEPGQRVLAAERADELAGAPVAWDQAWLAAAFAGTLTARHLARVDFLETWTKQAGFEIESCRQTIAAVAASAVTARRLRLGRGAPVLKSTEVYYARRQQPVGLFISFYNPRRICITSQVRWRG